MTPAGPSPFSSGLDPLEAATSASASASGSATNSSEFNATNNFATTYEEKKAREYNSLQADRVHWENDMSYRNQPYRHLYHQRGVIGTFSIRLLEAKELKRSYWSALAVGPVKLLGLSKAYGPVSSYVSFALDPRNVHNAYENDLSSSTNTDNYDTDIGMNLDSKPGARASAVPSSLSSSSFEQQNNPNNHQLLMPEYVSSVISQNNNPVWDNCHFNILLNKGQFHDGQGITLQVRVDEDSTAVENLIPGVPSGGDSRLLGIGYVDLTSLCLGQSTETGESQVGVLDTWVPISLPNNNDDNNNYSNSNTHGSNVATAATGSTTSTASIPLKQACKGSNSKKDDSLYNNTTNTNTTNTNNNKNITGHVRVLISYQPNGLQPQVNDVVALESFARQNILTSTSIPIVPSLLPLRIVDISTCNPSWLLVEYQLPYNTAINTNPNNGSATTNNTNLKKKACIKVHRNAIFVIERKNMIDETLNLALLPTDVFFSTPLGRTTRDVVTPLVVAGKQIIMPALLSSKLLWMAVRTTALASITGVHAASSAMWNEGSTSLTQEGDRNLQRPNGQKFMTI